MERIFLRLMLSGRNTIKSTLDYCKDRDICKRNKDILAKKLLSISGYNSPSKADPIPIYQELVKLSMKKPVQELNDPESNIRMTPAFAEIISNHGSDNLRSFLIFNNILIPDKKSRLSRLKDKAMELYSNPLVSSTLFPLISNYANQVYSDKTSRVKRTPNKKKVQTKKIDKKKVTKAKKKAPFKK